LTAEAPLRVSFVISGHPVGKGRPRTRVVTARGHTFASHYTPAKTRKFEASIKLYAQQAMAGRRPIEDQVSLLVIQSFAVPASWSRKQREQALAGNLRPTVKPDWDNIGKAVSDALNGIVYLDDKQIISARIEKWYGPQPELEVVVEAAQHLPAAIDKDRTKQLTLGLANDHQR
jgi:Holliday junction resolvase RusA-like endonuclease